MNNSCAEHNTASIECRQVKRKNEKCRFKVHREIDSHNATFNSNDNNNYKD